MKTRFKIVVNLFILFLASFNVTNAARTVPGCEIDDSYSETGAVVRFFDYSLLDLLDYLDINFLSGGYLSNNQLKVITQVQDISWDSGLLGTTLPYGVTGVPSTHFVMEITGYYHTSQTGFYNIKLDAVGSTALFMGSGFAFDCCAQLSDFTANDAIVTNGLTIITLPTEIYMEAGLYYPFKIVYVRYGLPGAMDVKIALPDGSVDSTIGSNLKVFSVAGGTECSLTTPQWSSTTSSSIYSSSIHPPPLITFSPQLKPL